jgi:hypothetical protein
MTRFRNRTSYIPACSTVPQPQPTTVLRAPTLRFILTKQIKRVGGEQNYTGAVFKGDSNNRGAGLSDFTTKVFATLSNEILKVQAPN